MDTPATRADPKTVKRAKTAFKAKDWKSLREVLEPVFEKDPNALSEEHYHQLLWSLAATRGFEAGKRVIADAPEKIATSFLFMKAKAEFYRRQNDPARALESLETIQREFETKIDDGIEKSYYSLLKCIDKKEVRSSKSRSMGPITKAAEGAFKLLEEGRFADSESVFLNALSMVQLDEQTRENWRQSFRALISLRTGHEFDPGQRMQPFDQKPFRSLSVSGMGWSGSGAVYDYFSEFENIKRIGGEFPFIEGSFGVSFLFDEGSKVPVEDRVLALFRFALFGFSRVENRAQAKLVRFAKAHLTDERNEEYSRLVRMIMSGIAAQKGALPMELARDITRSYLAFKADLSANDDAVLPLFNNIIHAYNLDDLRLVDGMDLFYAVRDPRSNYVARIRESKMFQQSAEAYVRTYRKRRMEIESKRDLFIKDATASSNSSRVHFVQFENFVMDRQYRQNTALKAGLNLSQQLEYSRFKPWASEKNVYLFEDYENQDEIRLIEKELEDYCVNLDAFERESTKS